MPDRREFLKAAGFSLATPSAGWSPLPTGADSTWMTYALDAESYWAKLPFLDRLRKIAEAGFGRYEFGRWKTKDIDAIAKLNEELGLQSALFLGYPGLRGPRWKEGLLEAIADPVELAARLGAVKVSIVAADRDEKLDRDEQLDELVDALKESVEKIAEFEAVLILEAGRASPGRPGPLIASVEEAADVVKAVASDRVRCAFSIDRAAVDAGKVVASIEKHKDRVGYYRLVDFGPPSGSEKPYARALRAIHDVGHADPIGLGLAPKGDPLAAIEAIRKLDDAAKAL